MKSYSVSGSNLLPAAESDEAIDLDPRGYVLMWEEPQPWARYIMSCDPSVGITGWNRGTRTDGDHKTDNGVIEIFRIDAFKRPIFKDGKPDIDPITKAQRFYYQDLQVCEFAAPCDAVEIARVANVLGRVYAGADEDQCEFIFESQPGPGILTLQELLRLGYGNLWQWETIAGDVAEQTTQIGWRSWRESQRLLWFRARRHLMEDHAYINSKWLVEEYSNAVIDVEKMRAKAAYGSHDDRIQAASMAFWAGHKWTYDPERTYEPVTEKPISDWQLTAPVLGDTRSVRDQWVDIVEGWD